MLEELAHEEFVQPEARRLEELRLDARELRAEAGIRSGVDAALIGSLRALTVEHPLRERAHALLVRALAATGRQAEALAEYAAIRARLDDELGIEPGPELRMRNSPCCARRSRPPVRMPTRRPRRGRC